jgi:hypothetical protein
VYKVFGWLGILASVLSFVLLVKHGFDLGSFAGPLQLILDYHEAWMRFALGWAAPYLRSVLTVLGAWTGWTLDLQPHWRHVLTLSWLYIGATSVSGFYYRNDGADDRQVISILSLVLGLIATTATAVAAGTVALDGSAAILRMSAFALSGLVVYEGLQGRRVSHMLHGGRTVVSTNGLSLFVPLLVVDLALFWISGADGGVLPAGWIPPYGLVLLILLVAFILLWLALGAVLSLFPISAADESYGSVFLRQPATRFALRMARPAGGAALFLLANAGLKLAGV